MSSFHGDDKRLKSQMKLAEKELSERNFKLVSNFKKKLLSEGIGKLRISRYISILRKISEFYDAPFDEWDDDDIIEILAAVEEEDYAQGTKNEFKKTLKKFIKVQYDEYSPLLRLIKQKRSDSKIPEVLSEEDILSMVESLNHPRDRALVGVGYEAGLRIGELAGLKIGDIVWKASVNGDLRAKIRVKGKTGERQIPLVTCIPYLKRWLEEHPFRDDDRAIVFCSLSQRNYGSMIGYQMMWKTLVSIGKEAGIKKRVNPHLLRHSRATVLANFFTEAQMCEFFGWTQGSKMPKIYVHLSGRDIDKAVNKMYGFEEQEEEKEVEAKPKRCSRCGYVNAPTDKYCGRCALILDEKERAKLEVEEPKIAEDIMSQIMQNPQMLGKVKEMIDFVEKARSNPELMQVLKQMMDENVKEKKP